MTSYAQRERELLEQHALSVLADPSATDGDRRSAKARLERGPLDYSRLSPTELEQLEVLLRKVEGAPPRAE